MGARDKIREFFITHVGEIVTTKQIRRVAGISEYARRIRELRDEEGYQILSHNDRADLKPGQYIMETTKRKPALSRVISPALRTEILERNGYTCQLCGAGAGDPDPCNPGRTIRLHIDHIRKTGNEDWNDKKNLRALCSNCNQGKSNIRPPTETALDILAKIRKLGRFEQMEIYDFLKRKFEIQKI